MDNKSYRIWVLLLAAILLIGGYLYHRSMANRQALHEEAIHRTDVVKENFINILNTHKTDKKGRKPFKRHLDTLQKDTVTLKQKLADYMQDIGKSDFFDQVLVTGKAGYVLYPPSDMPMTRFDLTKDEASKSNKMGVITSEMVISGTDYRVYQEPVTYLGHSFNILGLIKETKFEETGRQLNFSLIYFLIILVVLVVISFPILVLLGMSEGDMLHRSHFDRSAVSLVLVIAIVGFTFSFIPIDQEIRDQQEEMADDLKGLIIEDHKQLLNQQIRDLNQAFGLKDDKGKAYPHFVDSFTRFYDTPCFCLKENIEPGKHYNELLEVKPDGLIRGVIFKDSNDGFLNQFEHDLPLLDDRDYVNNAETHVYHLGSHFSYNTREFEGVISRKLVGDSRPMAKQPEKYLAINAFLKKNNSDNKENKDTAQYGDTPIIQAITYDFSPIRSNDSRFTTSQDTLLNLKYLLLNPSGDVYYSAENFSAHLQNLADGVGQSKWQEIKTLIANNQGTDLTLNVSITLDGHAYQARIYQTGLQDSLNLQRPIWLMILNDPKVNHFRNFTISSHGFAGILLFMGVLFTIILLYVLLGRQASSASYQSTDLFWLKPSFFKSRYYLFCSGVTLLHILLFFLILLPLNKDVPYQMLHESGFIQAKTNMWVAVLMAGESTTFLALMDYFLLSGMGNRVIEGKINSREIAYLLSLGILMVVLILLAFGISGYCHSPISGLTGLLALQGVVILLIITGLFTRFLKFSNSYQKYYLWLYNSFLAITLMFVGLMVGLISHHTAFQFEKNLWDRSVKQAHQNGDKASFEAFPQDSATFFNALDRQRRNWLTTYAPPDYPVVNHYTYPGKPDLKAAFQHPCDSCNLRDNNKGQRNEASLLGFWLPRLLGLIIVIATLYYLVKALTKRFFLKNYLEKPAYQLMQPAPFSYGIALDNAEAMRFYAYHWQDDNLIQVDLAGHEAWEYLKGELANTSKVDGIILGNVQMAFTNPEQTHKLLPLIQQCKEKGIKIAITGSKPFQELKALMPGPDNDTPGEAWRLAFGDFITQVIPLDHETGLNAEDQARHDEAPYLRRKLYQEIQYGPNYEQLSGMLEENLKEQSFKVDEVDYEQYIQQIKAYNEGYYQEIWERLPFREKQMVYNFATEGFVNYKNKAILRSLFQKGVMKVEEEEGDIVLFNDSFADFARMAPTKKEIQDFEVNKNTNGNIKNMRNALLTFIFLVLLGISILRPEIIDRYIGALSGVLALVSALSSALAKAKIPIPFLKSKGFLET